MNFEGTLAIIYISNFEEGKDNLCNIFREWRAHHKMFRTLHYATNKLDKQLTRAILKNKGLV
jgi:small-conductance mechanosensitive channel